VADDDSRDWRVFGDDAVGRNRRHPAISGQRSSVQLRRTGAASAGVGGQGGTQRHHAPGLSLDALDHGGSGAGGNPLFPGGEALLRTAGAQKAQARSPGGAGTQVADRSLCPAARRRNF